MTGNFRSAEQRAAVGGLARKSSPSVRLPASPTFAPANGYVDWKRIVDLTLGLVLSLLLLPFVLLTALLIIVSSRGPAFYTQVRLGRFGKPFTIWKLRTMAYRCEDRSGPQWSKSGDTRVTPIGRILRKLHIDEFPQLWNVLRGDMSLVGPRPERPEFFPVLSSTVPNYANRLMVRPGVSGLAQVYLPPDEDVDGVKRKQLYDLYYIRNLGFSFDLRIVVATALQAAGAPHFLVRPALFLPHEREIEGKPAPIVVREISPLRLMTGEVHSSTTAS